MALSKEKKVQVVNQIDELLNSSKLTVVAKYSGTSVKSLQKLRADSRPSGTKIHVIKNRLFIRALKNNDKYMNLELDNLNGQLIYAFNAQDEVAPAQNLATFAKEETQIEFVGGLTSDGKMLSADEVKYLANLPSKDQLRAHLVGTIAAPLSGFVNVLSGNVRGLLNTLNARSEQISN
jgi:large subunit ribosomal protein L10